MEYAYKLMASPAGLLKLVAKGITWRHPVGRR
jgi:hypothetical protein